jgi:hypothetical protein
VPRLRALFFTLACVLGATLGTAGASYAGALAECVSDPVQSVRPLPAGGVTLVEPACQARLGATASTPVEPGSPVIATAVRHVPRPGEPASLGGPDPATDKAMALVIGWMVLVLLAGGVCAGRRVPARVPDGSASNRPVGQRQAEPTRTGRFGSK